MPTSICPECTEEVYVDGDCEQGDHVVCDECGSKLTVVGLDPVELDLHDPEAEASDTDDFGTYDLDEDRY